MPAFVIDTKSTNPNAHGDLARSVAVLTESHLVTAATKAKASALAIARHRRVFGLRSNVHVTVAGSRPAPDTAKPRVGESPAEFKARVSA